MKKSSSDEDKPYVFLDNVYLKKQNKDDNESNKEKEKKREFFFNAVSLNQRPFVNPNDVIQEEPQEDFVDAKMNPFELIKQGKIEGIAAEQDENIFQNNDNN